MVVNHPLSEETYTQLAMASPDRRLELYEGELREKPGMSEGHRGIVLRLARQLQAQLDAAEYEVRINEVRVRGAADTIVIPDLVVIPTTDRDADGRWSLLPTVTRPIPLIVEVWRPPAGGYDVDARIALYRQRGDLEIWRIHPQDRTLTSWVRQADGDYAETIYQSGLAQPAMLTRATSDRGARFDA